MDKINFDIPGKDGKWATYVSKYPADSGKVPATGFSAGTRNVITSATGQADKRSGGAIWNPNSLLSGAALDQYEAVFSTGTRLFIVNDAGTLKASTGNGVYTSITAGFTNPANFEFQTYQSRAYGCNGVDAPQCLDIVTSYGGVPYSFTTAKTKVMGCQIPGSAVTATRNTDSTANQVPTGSHTYKITYLYYSGVEESNGNTASAVCVNDGTHTSNALSNLPIGGYGVTARNIYRDNNDGAYTLLATVNDNTTTTYTDILPIGATPTPLSITNGLPPVFKYVSLYLDRLFVIDVTGKNILWSNAGQPDVFNPANGIAGPQDDVMTAIYVFNGLPYVFGQHTVGTILGTTDGTFYYSPLSTSVGCVDNRSIQTRSIVSVPTLMWLAATPNKGIYYTNGSIVQYLSDFIEDLTFNLAQISYLSRQNTQASQSAFQGGTASTGIDLLSNPGTIQTINPTALYSHAADWASGTLANTVTSGDQLALPVGNVFALAAGSLSGSAQISGSNVTLPTGTNFTGESLAKAGTVNYYNDAINGRYFSGAFAQSIIPSQTGTVTTITLPSGFNMYAGTIVGNFNITVALYNDIGGLPGSNIGSQTFSLPGGNGADQPLSIPVATVNAAVTGGTRYWIVLSLQQITNAGSFNQIAFTGGTWSGNGNILNGPAPWSTFGPPVNSSPRRMAATYALTRTAVPESGVWTSAVYDSHCLNQSAGMHLSLTGAYPSGTSASVFVQGSANQSSWTTTDTLSSPNGSTIALTGGQFRYWRVVTNVATTDNLNVPLVGIPTLTFNTTGTWVSPAILCTTDITALNALTQLVSLPAGTTSTLQIRTSADASTWSSYSALGSATPNKYAQIKVTMTTDTVNTVSPSLASVELDWSITSTLISSAIDTGAAPPAGWGIFQYSQVGTTGTVSFSFRSASSSGGLTGSFSAVSNGGFPTATPLEFGQWKITLSATANNVPEVNSVTVNWFLTSGNNVRAASLFFNKSYYLSVATVGSTTNNILIEYDYEGNWRIHNGATIGTFATYFTDAFYCDSTNGKVYNAFKLPTDNGTTIPFDLRSKCFDFGDNNRLKIVRSLKVTGVNTGTTIHTYYSMDRGTTWIEMLNSSGAVGYTTTNDNSEFVEYFVPDFSGAGPLSGRNVIFRITSSDAFPCSILSLSPTVKMRKGKAIREAGAGV